MVFIINIIITPIANSIGNKTSFKTLAFLSSFFFIGMYYVLQEKNVLFLIALLYSINTTLYYLARHNYAANVLKKKVGGGVGIVMIIAILATMPAVLIGSLLVTRLSVWLVISIALIIYLIGIIPLNKINVVTHRHTKILQTLKMIPRRNILFFAFVQFRTILFFLFPLYIFINIKGRLEFIGIINIIVGIASIIFIYFYSRRIDKKKKDYMLIASIFLSSILFIEVRFATAFILLFTSFFEGIAIRMYEVSITRDLYLIPKKIDKSCYFLALELINNGVKLLIVLTLFILNFSLYTMLIILIIGIFMSGLIKYQTPKEMGV